MRDDLRCDGCHRTFPVIVGIPDLRVFPDPYIDFEADRNKGLQVAARLPDCTFSELIDYYYSTTLVVPPHHARQYKRGLMAAAGRAQSALASWEKIAGDRGRPANSLLEVGCGTAPLLVAAARTARKLAGVDIAFRWLIVAKKRLAEAGLGTPLFCACAEALPFPDGAFDRVVMDSVLEVVSCQRAALAECHRVMVPGSHLFLSTPNRFSIGPDPHIGAWAGGMWPKTWLAAYARRQRAIPPKRSLLWKRSLASAIQDADFTRTRIFAPGISAGQRDQFSQRMRLLIDCYRTAQRLPLSRELLHLIGPLLCAVTEKPALSGERA